MLQYFHELEIKSFYGKTILLDIDGTITCDGSLEIEPQMRAFITQCATGAQVYLCSNSSHHRARTLAESLGVAALTSAHRKPDPRVLGHLSKSDKNLLIVIGDKFLTDGLLAKKIGAPFIKVRRLVNNQEALWVKLINFMDDVAAWIGFDE